MDEVQARARYEELYGTQDDTAWADIVTGAATVILAMGDGKKAAQAMDAYLKCQPIAG